MSESTFLQQPWAKNFRELKNIHLLRAQVGGGTFETPCMLFVTPTVLISKFQSDNSMMSYNYWSLSFHFTGGLYVWHLHNYATAAIINNLIKQILNTNSYNPHVFEYHNTCAIVLTFEYFFYICLKTQLQSAFWLQQ